MLRRKSTKLLMLGLLIALLAVAFIAVRVLQPTFEYEGRVLAASEFLELFNQGVSLHCVQIPQAGLDQIGLTVAYACFNTPEEAEAYSRNVVHAG